MWYFAFFLLIVISSMQAFKVSLISPPRTQDCIFDSLIQTRVEGKGTIWYDDEAKAYAVFTSVEGGFDSQLIGVACNLPDEFKVKGLEVVFTGAYYKCDQYKPRFPGQTYYFLKVYSIRRRQGK